MAVQQISQIQIRRGLLQDLGQLASGEFGWALDQLRLFIGNGSLLEGAPSEGNTEIMTRAGVLAILNSALSGIGSTGATGASGATGSSGASGATGVDPATAFLYRFKGLEPGYEVQTGIDANTPIIRTLQNKLDDVINILDFGAVGDGIVDDLDAIQRAIDQVYDQLSSFTDTKTKRIINFHPGIYSISGELRIPPYCVLRGAGKNSVIIRQNSPAATCIFKTTTSTGNYDSFIITNGEPPGPTEISNITFEFNVMPEKSIGVIESAQNISFHRCVFKSGTIKPADNDKGVAVRLKSNFRKTGSIFFTECDFQGTSTAVEIIDNKLVEEVVFDRCTFTDLFQGIAVHSSKSFTVMGLRVTNSIFDAISTYAILVTDNIAGVTSSLNTYLNVGTGFTSNTVVPLGYPLPRYSIRGDSPVSDILVSNVAAGDTINFNITSVDPAETFTYSVETWIGGSNIGNLLAQLPAEFAPPINNHTPITPVIKFGGNGSFSFGDFFFRTPDDDYFVDTVEHAASDIISFDTTSALKYGDRYQTIGRSLVVQPNTINFIPLLSKFFGGKIDYRVERFARYRTGTVTFTVDPLNLIVCWRDSYTEVHPTNITVEMEYSNFLSQTIVKRPILIIKSTSNDGPAIITYDVKSFVDENIGRPAFSADYIPPPPLYAIRATPESVEEGLGFNVRITGRNIVSCANGRRFKVTATGTNVNGYDFDLPLSTYYWIKGLDPVSRQRVDYASPGNTIFFKYTTPDRSETVSYEVVTPTGNEVQELDASPSELIVDVDQLPYLFKVKVREDFVTEGLETVTFSLYTWCIGEAESTTVVAFDNVDIIDSSLTPTLPPPTPTPIPTLTPTPTPTPIVFPTPEPVADYRIVANLVLLYPGTTVRFDVTSTNSSENLIYEIGPYSPTIPDPPHVNPSAFPNCVVGSVTYVNITGSLEGSGVWGNNVFGYTDDSDWNKAAVHAGLAYPGQSIRVVLTCLGTKSGFPVTTANGITTTAYPNMWCAVKLTIE